MRSLLRDLGTLHGVNYSCIVRSGEVLASTFPDDQAATPVASAEIVGRIAQGLRGLDRPFDELLVEIDRKLFMAVPVDDDFVVMLQADEDASLPFLRVAMQSSARQIRKMVDLPPPAPEPAPEPPRAAEKKAEPEPTKAPEPKPVEEKKAPEKPKPTEAAKKAEPAKKPEAKPEPKPEPKAKPAPPPDKGKAPADPVLPKILDLLTESIGPVARLTFSQGVAQWKESNEPTMANLGALAKILAADLSTDKEKQAFTKAVEELSK